MIFVRSWFGVTEGFPVHEFDNLLDDKIPGALDALARRWIEETHGSLEAWQQAWAKKEQRDRKERSRHSARIRASAMTLPGSGSPRSSASKKDPSRKEILRELKSSTLPLFELVKEMAGLARKISGPRIMVKQGSEYVPLQQVGGISSVCSRCRYLMSVPTERMAIALTELLFRDHSQSEYGSLRFGMARVESLSDVQRLDAADQIAPSFGRRDPPAFKSLMRSVRRLQDLSAQAEAPQPSATQRSESSSAEQMHQVAAQTEVPPEKTATPTFQAHRTSPSRARAPAPPGWIYATDAKIKYKIKGATFQGYRNKLGKRHPPDAEKDANSNQVRVRESALRAVLGLPPED